MIACADRSLTFKQRFLKIKIPINGRKEMAKIHQIVGRFSGVAAQPGIDDLALKTKNK